MAKSLIKLFRLATPKPSQNPNPRSHLDLPTLKKPPFSSSPGSAVAAPNPAKPSSVLSSQLFSRTKKVAPCFWPDDSSTRDSAVEISSSISSILRGISDTVSQTSPAADNVMLTKNILDIPWFSNTSTNCSTPQRKELSRERKQKHIFKRTESRWFTKLMRKCANRLGTESTLELFGKLGRETGIKEYNTLIKLCIENARHSNNTEDSLHHIHKAYQLITSMRERGFQIEEETYGPILKYMIDMGMTDEFQFFSSMITDENPASFTRIGYYQMLLWIRVGDENKIQELCKYAGVGSPKDSYELAESYLLALCESDRKKDLLQLFNVLDIGKVSSLKHVASIFKTLGRLQLDSFMEKFVMDLKIAEAGDENISSVIHDYTISMPNLVVEELIQKFNNVHEKLGIVPSIASCDKLITLCCDSLELHLALDIADQMCESGLEICIESFHPILQAIEQSGELNLVHSVYSVMRCYNLKPKGETIKSMITLYMKMKDVEGTYKLLAYVKEMNELPTTSMYNAIMAGYFRERNTSGALMVLKQMEEADIKPDSETFSYLISNSELEDDIIKYRKKMQQSGVPVTKHIYMALINAYAKFGMFEQAKQVVLDKEVPVRYLNELKSVLVSALASNGQISQALDIYDEIKQSQCSLEPKAVISLIEYLQCEGELNRLLQLLEELNGSKYWFDGCSRVILYCIRYNMASSAIDLLKQLNKVDKSSTYIVIDQIFSQIWEMEPTNLDIGLEVLRAIKEELQLHPSRTCLDFLLSTCVKVRNPQHAQMIWSEYNNVGLSYNVLTSLRMYQVLLASGENEEASKMLKRIKEDDPHIRYLIKSCKTAFIKPLLTSSD